MLGKEGARAMKLIHLSDLHIGKRVNEFSMIEDQKYILKKIINVVDEEKPDGVIIAGDVYDKSAPGDDAVKVLDGFLTDLARRKISVYMISGNHDSAVKLSFASELIGMSKVYIAPVYDGDVKPWVLKDENGLEARIYMLPFVKPVTVKNIFPDEADGIRNYTDACRVAISHMEVDEKVTNIIVTHQFVTGAVRSESEENVGGLDNVEAEVFDTFDYVALGHIHRPQKVGRETIRYCGTPLKYSLSEADVDKSVTIIDIEENKKVKVRTASLEPMRDMREIRGTFAELTSQEYYEKQKKDDYIYVTLTDEEDIPEAFGKLAKVYPNVMKLRYDNKRTRENRNVEGGEAIEGKDELTLFSELYEKQNNQEMTEEQEAFVRKLIDKIWKGEE